MKTKQFTETILLPITVGSGVATLGIIVTYLMCTSKIFKNVILITGGAVALLVLLWLLGIVILGMVSYPFLEKCDAKYRKKNNDR